MRGRKKNVKVVLGYEEVRDLANALYYLTSGTKPERDYSDMAAKCSLLFDMVKFGMIQGRTAEKFVRCKENDKDKD